MPNPDNERDHSYVVELDSGWRLAKCSCGWRANRWGRTVGTAVRRWLEHYGQVQALTPTPEVLIVTDCDNPRCPNCWIEGRGCDFEHPHPDHPCGKHVIPGVTGCDHCGNLDGSPECEAAGCWIPAAEAHLDTLYAQAWGIPDPNRGKSAVSE